jgi:hypothetical protein
MLNPNLESLNPGKDDFGLHEKIMAGAISGVIGSAIATPTEVVKIRFQTVLPGQPRQYRHTLHAFWSIYQSGGIVALYRGIGPNVLRAAVMNSAQLASYVYFLPISHSAIAPIQCLQIMPPRIIHYTIFELMFQV